MRRNRWQCRRGDVDGFVMLAVLWGDMIYHDKGISTIAQWDKESLFVLGSEWAPSVRCVAKRRTKSVAAAALWLRLDVRCSTSHGSRYVKQREGSRNSLVWCLRILLHVDFRQVPKGLRRRKDHDPDSALSLLSCPTLLLGADADSDLLE